MEVRFHRLAAQEYRNARSWYERRREGLGFDFRAEVDRAIARVTSQPDRWPSFRERFRRVRLRRFPYALYCHIADPDLILVLAVAHSRRRPGYWLRRERHE
jgi:ParE toxin of type II toxin-antitoxin system, parDE